jgi:hypothetical protein
MRTDIPHKRFRTGIANGSRILDGVDGRSHVVRRFREVSGALGSDLGGMEHLTEAQMQLVRSAAGLVCLRESLDVKAAKQGCEKVNVGTYCLISNTLRRVLTTIGLQRVARDVSDDDAMLRQAYDDAVNEVEATP